MSHTTLPWGTERYTETIVHETNDEHPEEADLSFRGDKDNFYYNYTRRLRVNGELLRKKNWQDVIPRDFQ